MLGLYNLCRHCRRSDVKFEWLRSVLDKKAFELLYTISPLLKKTHKNHEFNIFGKKGNWWPKIALGIWGTEISVKFGVHIYNVFVEINLMGNRRQTDDTCLSIYAIKTAATQWTHLLNVFFFFFFFEWCLDLMYCSIWATGVSIFYCNANVFAWSA